MVMDVCRLLGREEGGSATQLDTNLLRLLTPVLKLYTGKQVGERTDLRSDICKTQRFAHGHPFVFQAVAVVSEGLECFGGQGYIEDTGLPGLLRDAQVSRYCP